VFWHLLLPKLFWMICENWDVCGEEAGLGFSEGYLDKTANEYCTEVTIPHVLSSKI
jgi:hypothetical protein